MPMPGRHVPHTTHDVLIHASSVITIYDDDNLRVQLAIRYQARKVW